MDIIIKEIEKIVGDYASTFSIDRVGEYEYQIKGKIKDLAFTYKILLDRSIYQVDCFHGYNSNIFSFNDYEAINQMSSCFKALGEMSYRIYAILKKYK